MGDYPFTTLGPNLGDFYGHILADIPGLIEGASGGKGLGIKFLRHIERTRILFHIISSESKDPLSDYRTIREELGAYNKELLVKKEYVFFGKSDMISSIELKKKVASLKKKNPSVDEFSIHDYDSIGKIKKILNGLIRKKNKNPAPSS